ncbi:multifunctional CCA addition/repair protein [Lampropedia puyangensis]|uniref:Multifunctional CCA protein n=1 Tax=Lampropedia puyangensis TaxID=1330072 RepID=A0A4S8FH97_9BURK|nr:multifunctional CCA addition/repair protein [Lampropedia puyangensis]THU05182.1 multifunctional CCA addition/repair protein [Lampropedia puyangensis]
MPQATNACPHTTLPDTVAVYMVGGAVRDRLLGRAVQDHDWVVIGATPALMEAHGFTPVGKDFPVFLHPQTHEEYALARTERKSGHGYKGFTVYADTDVSLEEDLARRDLTINAMAVRTHADGYEEWVDPFHGQQDIAGKVLRHVTLAFTEDPLRILRLARFAARFGDFHVAPETQTLMQEMVSAGEVAHLVAERVWQELARGLMENAPTRMFEVLRDCGALAIVLPELDALWGVPQPAEHHPEIDTGLHTMMVLEQAAQSQAPLAVRFAALMHDLGKGTSDPEQWPRHIGHEIRGKDLIEAMAQRLKIPAEIRELAALVAQEHTNIHRSLTMTAAALVRLLERCDALRRPERFALALWACECDARGRQSFEQSPYPQRSFLLAALHAAQQVDTASIAQQAAQKGLRGDQIGQHIHMARVQAVQAASAS